MGLNQEGQQLPFSRESLQKVRERVVSNQNDNIVPAIHLPRAVAWAT
jgi:hypothetical protein